MCVHVIKINFIATKYRATSSQLSNMFCFILMLSAALINSSCGLIAPMKNTNGETDVDSVSTHVLLLEQMFSGFKTEMDVLKADTTAMKSKIATLESENAKLQQELTFVNTTFGCSGPEISFEAVYADGTALSVGAGTTLTLSHVTHNAGGGYHNASGIFRAPEGGTYLFWAHIVEGAGKEIYVYLMREGVKVGQGYTPTALTYGTASITTIVDVKKGDDVWFQAHNGGTIIGWSQSSYGGILLCKH